MTEPVFNQEPILISSLPQVTTAGQFFSIEKMVMPIVIPVVNAPEGITQAALTHFGGIPYEGHVYIPTAIFGSPENMFLRMKNGLDFKLPIVSFTFRFHGELDLLLSSGIVYDASEYEVPNNLTETEEYYVENCIKRNLIPLL